MTAPVAVIDSPPSTKYGYTIISSPAISWGIRCCFVPYTNNTNPMPLATSDRKRPVGSSDMVRRLLFLANRIRPDARVFIRHRAIRFHAGILVAQLLEVVQVLLA